MEQQDKLNDAIGGTAIRKLGAVLQEACINKSMHPEKGERTFAPMGEIFIQHITGCPLVFISEKEEITENSPLEDCAFYVPATSTDTYASLCHDYKHIKDAEFCILNMESDESQEILKSLDVFPGFVPKALIPIGIASDKSLEAYGILSKVAAANAEYQEIRKHFHQAAPVVLKVDVDTKSEEVPEKKETPAVSSNAVEKLSEQHIAKEPNTPEHDLDTSPASELVRSALRLEGYAYRRGVVKEQLIVLNRKHNDEKKKLEEELHKIDEALQSARFGLVGLAQASTNSKSNIKINLE